MRILHGLVIALLFLTGPLAAQDAADDQQLFNRALGLHDQGDYDGAIVIYKQLLARMPEDQGIQYELAFSTYARGDRAEAIRLASAGAKKAGKYQVLHLELLGNAYSAEGKWREAIATFKRGIKADPKYPRIHFNLGATYARQGKARAAREEFERAIELDPTYATAQHALAEMYRVEGYRIPAVLAYGRYLSLTQKGELAVNAATQLRALVHQGVTAEGEGQVSINIDPSSKKDLGDFSVLEMMLVMAAGSSHRPEKSSMSEYDREAESVSLFLQMLSESAANFKRGFVGKTYVPFYSSLVEAGHASTFAHLALAPLDFGGMQEWMAAHQTDVAAFNEWLQRGVSK